MTFPQGPRIMAFQFMCCIQKIALYETKSRYYLVGTNISETKYRVLKIDRTVPYELVIIDDKVEYDQEQIKQLLAMIHDGNRPKNPKAYDKDSTGLHQTVSAFGIVGFIRFLEGYYIILISERKKIAQIGGHTIYKIMDTCMVHIPNETIRSKYHHDSESKYLKSFQNVDLSSNFYFSYTYDLTQSLQYNMSLIDRSFSKRQKCECKCHLDIKQESKSHDSSKNCATVPSEMNFKPDDNSTRRSFVESNTTGSSHGEGNNTEENKGPSHCVECLKNRAQQHHFVSSCEKPCTKFVWNKHMLKDVINIVHSDWLLYMTHGFIGQCNISVYGRPLYLTLIARRSNEYAGTRFLKRGLNDMGFVANDVETEQIVHDASTLSFQSGSYTSFVQLRGSVPLYWSQDLQHGVVPKPQIQVDRTDPYCTAASVHFNSAMRRFGSPIIVFNLVKRKERKTHEQILGKEFSMIVNYLNQFLPPQFHIKYIWFDIARYSKNKDMKVVEKLEQYAEQIIESTGFFHSGPDLYANEIRPDESWTKVGGHRNEDTLGREQTGVLRVNCVDCLDRTNIAQFVVGKHVLGLQLYALGVIDKPVVNFDCDSVRLLEDLYEDHGDTLAVQYGGSQLVHRIRTYLKTAPWTSHSRDIYQTLCRYYSGAFTDSEKQQAINLFLGKFIPEENCLPLWDHPTDYYFHHVPSQTGAATQTNKSYTKWFDDEVIASLPLPCQEVSNRNNLSKPFKCLENIDLPNHEESVDLFLDFYRPDEFSEIDRLFSFNLPSSYREFIPATLTEPSPFVVRVARGGSATNERRLSTKTTFRRATSPGNEEPSSDSDSSSFSDCDVLSCCLNESCSTIGHLTFQDVFSSMKDYYGVTIQEPSKNSLFVYGSFVTVGYNATPSEPRIVQWTVEKRDENAVKQLSETILSPRRKTLSSSLLYTQYVSNGTTGHYAVSSHSLSAYKTYVKWLSS